MNETLRAELRELRARAYGADADIHDDPQALRRLEELEAIATGVRGRTPAPSAPSIGQQDAAPASEPSPAAEMPDPADHAPADVDAEEPDRAVWGRRHTFLWIVSLVVAALIASLVTFAVTRPAAPAATLEVSNGDWPSDFVGARPEGGRMFERFRGLQLIAVPQTVDQGATIDCLYLIRTQDSASNMLSVGCGAGPFGPTLSVTVETSWPQTVLDAYPAGTALKFVLDGDRVLVYTATAQPTDEPSAAS